MSAFILFLLGTGPRSKEVGGLGKLILYDVRPDSPRVVKEDGSIELADYVHIRNMTDQAFDLTGFWLSDSRHDLQKLPLDGVSLEPGGSQKIKLDPSWNFALKSSGTETVYLSDDQGNIIFKYTGAMKPASPVFSRESGIYHDEFDLKLSAKGDCRIFFTLNGDEPDENSAPYTEPIHVYDRSAEENRVVSVPNTVFRYLEEEYTTAEGKHRIVPKPPEFPVDKAFVVRAVAVDESGNISDVVTREYFFCGDKYKNIISIVADTDDLFGPCGIVSTGSEYDEWYRNGMEGDEPRANFRKKGREWEIPADMDYFRSGIKVFEQKCGLKVHGKSTRNRRDKNFQVKARNCYSGSDVFEYDFFDNEQYRSDGLLLRSSFRESVALDLISEESIIKQKTTDRAALFVNGEFWNNVYIRQKLDERYFFDHFGIDPDNLMIMNETFLETDYADEEESEKLRLQFFDLYDFIQANDLSVPENYSTIKTMMDTDNYMDYFAINTWIGNTDWQEVQNDEYWRVIRPYDKSYGDGRFRWIIHDVDQIFRSDEVRIDENYHTHIELFNKLIENEDFRMRFADKLERLGNTSFSEEHIKKCLESGKWDESECKEIHEYLTKRSAKIDQLIKELRKSP